MKQCKNYCIRFFPIIVSVVILIMINVLSKDSLTTEQLITAVASSLITAVGWIFSLQLNYSAFQRSEIIKNKDKLVSLIEKLFDGLQPLYEKRETTEKDIELFITNQVTELSLKKDQIERVFRKKVCFLSDGTLAKLQSEPIDILALECSVHKEKLSILKKDVLSEIDTLYEEWLKTL